MTHPRAVSIAASLVGERHLFDRLSGDCAAHRKPAKCQVRLSLSEKHCPIGALRHPGAGL